MAPRRSLRKKSKSPVDGKANIAEKASMLRMSKEDVERTMRELGEMEERLHSAAKRQRMAVASSKLHVEGSLAEQGRPFEPRALRGRKEVVNDRLGDKISGGPDWEEPPMGMQPGRRGLQ